jgi:hypothetical protein
LNPNKKPLGSFILTKIESGFKEWLINIFFKSAYTPEIYFLSWRSKGIKPLKFIEL